MNSFARQLHCRAVFIQQLYSWMNEVENEWMITQMNKQ